MRLELVIGPEDTEYCAVIGQITLSIITMISPSTTCGNTIKRCYEKLKDASHERKK